MEGASNPNQTFVQPPSAARSETSIIHELSQKHCIRLTKLEETISVTIPCCRDACTFSFDNKASKSEAFKQAYNWLLQSHLQIMDTQLVWDCKHNSACPFCNDIVSVRDGHRMIKITANEPSSFTKIQSWAKENYQFLHTTYFTFKARFCCGLEVYAQDKRQGKVMMDIWHQLMASDHHVIVDQTDYLLVDMTPIDGGFCPCCARQYTADV